jgi:hypothetical protein
LVVTRSKGFPRVPRFVGWRRAGAIGATFALAGASIACSSSASQAGGGDAAGDSPRATTDSGIPEGSPNPGDGAGSDVPLPDGGFSAHILVADQFNNRVVELDRGGNIVWTFGDGSSMPGPASIVAPNDAERLPNGDTLVSGTGAPAAASSAYGVTETACAAAGCPDNRVLIVDASGTIKWQYGQDGGAAGSGPNELSSPVSARGLPTGNILITDQGNNRVLEVTPQKTIMWQYPADLDAASPLRSPNSAERLATGNTLIADEGNNRVVEIDPSGKVVWQFPASPDKSVLSGPAFASRLPSGNTLVSDSGNSRVVEVTPGLTVAWTFVTNMRASSFPQPFPSHAVRIANQDTLIADQLNDQVLEVDPNGAVVFTYGQIQLAGNAPGELNTPYDAKAIGDYTGLTAPQ